MKQEEKTQRTKTRILHAALAEFGTKSYDAASVNAICNSSHISKGLLYHNFSGKEDLYLKCVQICYTQIIQALKNAELNFNDSKDCMHKLLILRQQFFAQNPYLANIFFNSILQPPKQILPQLQKIREEFDDFYEECYRNILRHVPLRKGITEDMAVKYFFMFQEMFNCYFQLKADEAHDYQNLIHAHEGSLAEVLDIILYGVAREV